MMGLLCISQTLEIWFMDSDLENIYCPPGCECNICNNAHSVIRYDELRMDIKNYPDLSYPYTEFFA